MLLATSALVGAQTGTATAVKTGYAPVNGISLYYEIHGGGEPLILLHGGRTTDIDRALSFEAMADDMAALMKHLGIEKADVMDYSLGGGAALRTAIQYPGLVRKLMVVSTVFRRDGWYPEVLAAMGQMGAGAAETMKPSPIYQTYARIAPRPADWPVLLAKTGEAPAMPVFADADAMRPEHMVRFFQLLGGGKKDAGWYGSGMSDARLAILPGVTHYNICSSPALASTVTPFLDAPMQRTG